MRKSFLSVKNPNIQNNSYKAKKKVYQKKKKLGEKRMCNGSVIEHKKLK